MRLNIEQLGEAAAHDQDFMLELIQMMIDDGFRRVARIRAAYDRGEWAATAQEAHSLKGAALNVGAEELAARCGKVDALVRQLHAAPTADDIAAIAEEFDALKNELNETAGKLRG